MKNENCPLPVVRLIISDANGKILILQRKNTHYKEGNWCLPGGKVDYGQTVEEAIINELKTETSLNLLTYHFLFYQDSLPKVQGSMHCINLYFKCEYEGNVLLNKESGQFSWIGPDELVNYDLVFGNEEALKNYWNSKNTNK